MKRREIFSGCQSLFSAIFTDSPSRSPRGINSSGLLFSETIIAARCLNGALLPFSPEVRFNFATMRHFCADRCSAQPLIGHETRLKVVSKATFIATSSLSAQRPAATPIGRFHRPQAQRRNAAHRSRDATPRSHPPPTVCYRFALIFLIEINTHFWVAFKTTRI